MQRKKFTICCDMDDTIEHLIPAWCKFLNNKYGLNVSASDITEWDICKFFPTLTKTQVFEPLWIAEFWDTVEPHAFARQGLYRLIEDGHDVYICTNTHYALAKEKFDRCLFKHFPFLDRHKLILTCNKQMVKCDILIDDGTHNIIGDYVGILMNASHNESFDVTTAPNVIRAYDWLDVYDIINKLSIGEE